MEPPRSCLRKSAGHKQVQQPEGFAAEVQQLCPALPFDEATRIASVAIQIRSYAQEIQVIFAQQSVAPNSTREFLMNLLPQPGDLPPAPAPPPAPPSAPESDTPRKGGLKSAMKSAMKKGVEAVMEQNREKKGNSTDMKKSALKKRSMPESELPKPPEPPVEEQKAEGPDVTDDIIGALCMGKGAKSKAAEGKEEVGADHPLAELLSAKSIDINAIEEACKTLSYIDADGKPEVELDSCVSTQKGLPPPLFFAVGIRSAGLVGLFVEYRADVRKRHTGARWKGIMKGMTPLEAAVNQKLHFKGTKIGQQYQDIEQILHSEEERLKGRSFHNRTMQSAAAFLSLQADILKLRQNLSINLEEADQEEEEAEEEARRLIEEGAHDEFQHHYEIQSKIGDSTFGTVSVALHKETHTLRAVKSIPNSLLEESGYWQEVAIMSSLDHPNIMRFFGTHEDRNSMHIVTEYCAGGGLFEAMMASPMGFSETVTKKLAQQMLRAVCYLHNQNICHRDLKPDNFLISNERGFGIEEAHVKLVDFGTSKNLSSGEIMQTKVCSLHYVAPEILSPPGTSYTEKVDVWSLGILIFLMLCGVPPFECGDDRLTLKRIKQGLWAFEPADVWQGISQTAKALIQLMLLVDPDSRCTSDDALNHRWLEANTRTSLQHQSQQCQEVAVKLRAFMAQNRLKKVAMQIIAQQLSDDAIDDLRDAFVSLDPHQHGTLNIETIADTIMNSAYDREQQYELRQMLHNMDDGGTGEVNYTEFIAAMLDRKKHLQVEACRVAFNIFDIDGNGVISRQELATVLGGEVGVSAAGRRMSMRDVIGLDMTEVDRIVNEVDQDGNGEIDFEEFMKMMCGTEGPLAATALAGVKDRQTCADMYGAFGTQHIEELPAITEADGSLSLQAIQPPEGA